MSTFEVKIPFWGFYYSIHSENVDYIIQNNIEYVKYGLGCAELADKMRVLIYSYFCGGQDQHELFHFKDAYYKYAKQYVEGINSKFNLDLKFRDLVSPKFYNYATDEIFAEISGGDIVKIFDEVDKEDLRDRIKYSFTSRDGFISHYPHNIEQWPNNVCEWDHNQLSILLELFFEAECGEDWQFWVWEDCNGEGEEIIEAGFEKGNPFDDIINEAQYIFNGGQKQIGVKL